MADDLTAAYFAGAPHAGVTLLSRRHWDIATQAEQRSESLRPAANSAGMEEIQSRFLDGRHAASRAGDVCFTAADSSQQTSRAYVAYHRSTVTLAEIAAAQRDADSASDAVQRAQAAGRPTGALCDARDAAARHLADLKQRRAAAIAELERVLGRILERLHARPGRADQDGGRPRVPGTGTPLPTPPRGINVPGPPTPGLRTPAPPATPPQTSISNTGPSTDTIAALLSAAAKPQVQAPQMPMQQQPVPPMMQMPQVPQQSQPAPKSDRKRGPIDEDDVDDLLSEEDRDAPGLAAAAVAAPRPAPAGSIAPPSPAVPPVSGTSADGMVTSSPTSGRPGQPAAGAFAAPPATSLSGSHIASQQMAGPGTGAAPAPHHGAGMPMGAPLAGMPNAGAGGSGSARPPVLKHNGMDHGQSSLDAAVEWGTIARKKKS